MSPTTQACRARLCCCKAATRTSRVARGLTGRRRSSFRQPVCLPDTLPTVLDRVLSCRLRSQAQRPPCFFHRENSTVVVGSTTSEKASKLIAVGSACLKRITISTGNLLSNAGSGTVVYPNEDRYEGEWLNGKRHGIGALWLYDSDRYRIRYTGEWQRDKFHVSACTLLTRDMQLRAGFGPAMQHHAAGGAQHAASAPVKCLSHTTCQICDKGSSQKDALPADEYAELSSCAMAIPCLLRLFSFSKLKVVLICSCFWHSAGQGHLL